jgi:GNAT superfamily N-acetyltransferase
MSQTTPEFRQAGPADAAAVRALTRAAYAKWVPLIGREPMPMGADYDLAVVRHHIDLLFVGATLAALIETIDEPDCLLVENVAVSPDFQRRGYGRLLMARAERRAASLGRPRMRLYTNKAFAENVALYARLGYLIDREDPFGDSFVVHMSKAL